MNNKKEGVSDEKAGWDARQEFVRVIMELVTDMYNFKCENNFSSYKIAFIQCLMMTKPYINKYFTSEDDILFSFDDIFEIEKEIPSGDEDYIIRKKNEYYGEIMELLGKKEQRLYELLAKEKIFMPTHSERDLGSAVYDT